MRGQGKSALLYFNCNSTVSICINRILTLIVSSSTIDIFYQIYTFYQNRYQIYIFYQNSYQIYIFYENSYQIYIFYENRYQISIKFRYQKVPNFVKNVNGRWTHYKYSFAIANHSVLLNLIHILSARRLVEYFEVT